MRLHLCPLSLLFVVLLMVGCNHRSDSTTDCALAKAQAMVNNKDLPTADELPTIDSLLRIVHQVGNDSLEAELWKRKGDAHAFEGNYAALDTAFRRALALSHPDKVLFQAHVYNNWGNYAIGLKEDLPLAFTYANTSDSLLRLLPHDKGLNCKTQLYFLKLNLYNATQQLDSALVYVQKATTTAEANNDSTQMVNAYMQRFFYAFNINDHATATYYCDKAITLIDGVSNMWPAFLYHNKASLLIEQKRWQEALELTQQALQWEETHLQQPEMLVAARQQKGQILLALGRLSEAHQQFEEAVAIAEKHQFWSLAAPVATDLAEVLVQQRELTAAQQWAERALQWRQGQPIEWKVRSNMARQQALVARAVGNTAQWQAWTDTMTLAKDSVVANERYALRTTLDLKYQSERKSKDLLIAQRKQELMQQWMIFGGALGLIVLVGASVLVIALRRKVTLQTALLRRAEEVAALQRERFEQPIPTNATSEPHPATPQSLPPAPSASQPMPAPLAPASISPSAQPNIPEAVFTPDRLTPEVLNGIIISLKRLMDEEHLYRNPTLSLGDLAAAVDTNRSYLSHVINQHFGSNYNSYINFYRIEEAKHLLLTTNEKVTSVSEAVGFRNPSAFYNAFRACLGLSPGEYRKQAALGLLTSHDAPPEE